VEAAANALILLHKKPNWLVSVQKLKGLRQRLLRRNDFVSSVKRSSGAVVQALSLLRVMVTRRQSRL
jgi:hypothetical protein